MPAHRDRNKHICTTSPRKERLHFVKRDTHLPKRIVSAVLAAATVVGLIQPPMFTVQAATPQVQAAKSFSDTIQKDGSVTVELDIIREPDNGDPQVTIYSHQKPDGYGVSSWMGLYEGGGFSGNAFCMDHAKEASAKGMGASVTYNAAVSDNNLLTTIYTLGARTDATSRLQLSQAAKNVGGRLANVAWDQLTEWQWRKATQYALWMALENGNGKPMMSIEGQFRYDDRPSEHDCYTTDAQDYITKAMQKGNTEALETIQAAVELYAFATYRINVEKYNYATAEPLLTSQPVYLNKTDPDGIGPYKDFGWDPTTGTLNFGKLDPNDPKLPVYLNGQTNQYEILWVATSATQPLNTAEFLSVRLNNTNLPAGTYIQGLNEQEMAKHFQDLGPTEESPLKGYTGQAWGKDTKATAGQTVEFPLWQVNKNKAADAHADEALVSKNPTGEPFAAYWKVCIPEASVQAGKTQQVSFDLSAEVYDYRVYLGTVNKLNNGRTDYEAYQPFAVASPTAIVAKQGGAKWESPDVPEEEILYKTNVGGQPLQGAQFTFTGNGQNKTFTSQADGTINVQWTKPAEANYLAPGTYQVKESKAPAGYDLDSTPRTITLNGDGSQTGGPLTFRNNRNTGGLPSMLYKQDTDGIGLAGAVFEFESPEHGTSRYTTDALGVIPLQWTDPAAPNYLAPGTYMVTEVVPPPGYNLDDTGPKTLTLNEDGTSVGGPLVFVNTRKPTLKILKRDGLTGAGVEGVYFKVWKDGQYLGVIGPTGGNGTIDFRGGTNQTPEPIGGLENGTYRFQEHAAAPGYIPSDEIQEIEIDIQTGGDHILAVDQVVFTNFPYPEIEILKLDAETGEPVPNTTFRVLINGEVFREAVQTGPDGKVLFTYDQYGRFLEAPDAPPEDQWTITVTETSPADKYNRDKQDNNDYTLTQPLKLGEKLEPFVFKDVSYRSVMVIKKDAETTFPLAGAQFTLTCVAREDGGDPAGVKREGTTDQAGQVLFEDLPNGTYELRETLPPPGYSGNGTWGDGSTDAVYRFNITSANDPVIEIVYENPPKSGLHIIKLDSVTKQPIQGVVFTVTPLPPLTGGPKDYTTDENGRISIEGLALGTYTIEEKATVGGYVLNPQPETVFVGEEHASVTKIFENSQKRMLSIQKLDAITGEPLAGARFQISTVGGSHVADVTTGFNGWATLPNLMPGSYVVKEIVSPYNYILDPTPQFFEVNDTDEHQVFELIFDNSPYTNLYIRKVDALTGAGLEGARFTIWKDGAIVAQDAVTDAGGYIHIGKQTAGTFIAQETEAPPGYLLDDTKHSIYIKDGETGHIRVTNKQSSGLAVLKKDAQTGQVLEGATFELRTIGGELIGRQTTGKDGYARWSNLEPGWYVVSEITAPNGFILDAVPRNIQVKEFQPAELEWFNSSQASLSIIKRDKGTLVGLPGAVYEVRKLSGEVVATLTTGINGVATSDLIEPGDYQVVEIKAPPQYVLNSEPHLVTVKAGVPSTVEVFNEPERGILIRKVDANTQEPLAGAVFDVLSMDGRLIDSYVTDASGTIVTKALAPGFYQIVESKAPEGYVRNDEPQTVEVEADGATTVTFQNFPKTVIQVHKTDAETGDPLQGARFEVMTYDRDFVEYITTDKTGWASTQVLPAGEYLVREVEAPPGFTIDRTEHRATLRDGRNTVLRITNAPTTSLTITKVDAHTRKALAGAEFELWRDDGHGVENLIGTFITDELGMVRTGPLEPGYYMVRETKAPQNYAILTEEHRVYVSADRHNQLVVENQQLATLRVRKIDSQTGKPIAGAVFKLEGADRMDLIGLQETDANGEAVFYGLTEGAYIVTETQAPDGFSISAEPSRTVYVEYDKDNYVDFKDDENGSLVIVLQDRHTNEYLYGGQFIVTRESDQIVVYDGSTDTTGTIVVGNLLPGWYTVKQAFPPDGYYYGDVSTKVEILIGKQQTVYFKDVTSGLVIEKVDAQNPKLMLEGARFKVTRNPDGIVVGEYVTGKDGLALVQGLAPGLYTITELVAPNGYALDAEPQIIEVKEGTQAHATFKDTALSSITVTIVDVNTGEPIPGAVVEVWEQNGVLVNTYTSDATGLIQTERLPAGYYDLKLVSVPAGYAASMSGMIGKVNTVELKNGIETSFKFELAGKGTLKVMSVDTAGKALSGLKVSVTTLDGTRMGEYSTGSDGSAIVQGLAAGWYVVTAIKAPTGYLMPKPVEQRVEVKANGESIVSFEHGKVYGLQVLTTCAQTGQRVAGVSYRISRLDGATVGTYTSDGAGLFFVELEPGTYTVQMTAVPHGYSITEAAPRNITVRADGLTTATFTVAQMSSLRVKVVDGTTGAPLYGVRFQLKGFGNVIREYYSNNEGIVSIDHDVMNGSYTLEMLSAPNGYIVDSIPKSIEALVGSTTEIGWRLYKEGGQIQVLVSSADYNKTLDKAAGSPIQGAVFEIMNADTYQVVGQMISGANGIAASSGLPIGRYLISQVGSGSYYGVSQQKMEVRLKVNNDVVRVEYLNPSVNLGTKLEVQTNRSVQAGLTMRVDITEAANLSDVRLDNYFLHIKVPTDAARMVLLNTGKWSHSVFYTVKYKTNMNDYRTLASNLQSTNAYEYGVSTQSLNLQVGEYVTDIRFEFGTVPAGFTLIQPIRYTQYVLTTVHDGYKMITRMESGGQYNTYSVGTSHIDNQNPYSASGSIVIVGAGNAGSYGGSGSAALSGNSGQWTTSTAQWTTTIINTGGPGTLPQTGY